MALSGSSSYAIIGNGIAGITAAEILRTEDTAADIVIITDDPFPPYYRPALKDYLAGRVREDKLWARPTNFYQDRAIRIITDRVLGVQVGQHRLELQSGRQLDYQKLLLAQGARASRLHCPGLDLKGVMTLRTVADYQQMKDLLNNIRRIVVTGSGTLALETIETLRHRGYQVTHLIRHSTLWSEVLDATASDLVLQQERRDGVDVRLQEEIQEIIGKNGQVSGVRTTNGVQIPCELIVVAIGIDPIIDFVKKSGIPCGRGLKVDEKMRTAAPDIYAAGDVLETSDAMTGRTRVIGQWYPAIQQARAAAYAMLGLLDTKRLFRSSTFYNATFLYGLDFAATGITTLSKQSQDYQELVADPQPLSYHKVILKNGIPVGALALGQRAGVLAYKRAIDYKVDLTPVATRLFAADFDLDNWLDKQAVPQPILGVSREQAVPTGVFVISAVKQNTPRTSMQARLVPDKEGEPYAVVLSQAQPTLIGRQLDVSLHINDGSVSRRHAEISYGDGNYIVQDLGSANGTFLNGTRLVKGQKQTLKTADQLRFGNVGYTFQLKEVVVTLPEPAQPAVAKVSASQAAATRFFDVTKLKQDTATRHPRLNEQGELLLPEATQALATATVATFRASPALIVIKGGKPEVFYLRVAGGTSTRGKQQLKIGRDPHNDVMLNDVSVSRFHAELSPGPDGFYIRDLKSSNGIIVNQVKVTNLYRLDHEDRLIIGSFICYFMQPQRIEHRETVSTPSVAKACSTCGTIPGNPTARFCSRCGAPLKAAVAEVKR
jgi:NADPH-dependent 2,4-dienoyl-CoA reductase/sulfur reductase-like enzyme/pSer/pThr/pTyr-binding forkhead associated (FHA) protein